MAREAERHAREGSDARACGEARREGEARLSEGLEPRARANNRSRSVEISLMREWEG